MASEVEILIKALFEGSDQIDDAKEGIEGIGDAASDSKQPVEDFGGVLDSALGMAATIAVGVGAVAEAISLVYDAAKEAAELNLVKVQFESITEQAGLLSSALSVKLVNATEGISSAQQVMLGTTEALSSGLAQNEQDLINIASASAGLGLPMNDLVGILNNVSESKLGNIGVYVDDFKGKVESLVDSGLTPKAAELQVALDGINQRIQDTGHYAETSAGAFTQWENVRKDFTDGLKAGLEDLGGNVLPFFSGALQNLTDVQRFDNLHAAMTDYGLDIENLTADHEILGGLITKVDSELVGQMAGVVDWTNLTVSAFHAQGMGLEDAKEKTVDLYNNISALDELPLDTKDLNINADEVEAAQLLLDFLNGVLLDEKTLPVTAELDTSEVDDYTPPTKTGTITYLPAKGGIVAAGGAIHAAASGLAASLSSYWVGERGPEPFFPAIDGRIVSNTQAMAALRGGAGANAREIANAVRDGVREAMRDERVGNVYNLTMPTSSNPADVRTAFELMEAWGA